MLKAYMRKNGHLDKRQILNMNVGWMKQWRKTERKDQRSKKMFILKVIMEEERMKTNTRRMTDKG